MRNFRKKYFRFCEKKIAQNAQKFAKNKICAKIAKILRKRFSHFVETLGELLNFGTKSLLIYKKGGLQMWRKAHTLCDLKVA